MIRRKSHWKEVEKGEFLVRTGVLLNQGYTISEAIGLFQSYEREEKQVILHDIVTKLLKGYSFSEALNDFHLPKNIIDFIFLSEQYGNLANGLIDSGNLVIKTEETKQKLQKLFKYPLFLVWLLCLFMIIMYYYLFPQYNELFLSLNMDLPFITTLFLIAIEKAPYVFIVFLALSLLLLGYYKLYFQKKEVLVQGQIYANLPIFGMFYKSIVTYSFANNLSYLVKNGLSLYDSLLIFKDVPGLGYISEEAKRMIKKLEGGEKLHDALLTDTVYLKGLAYIVEHGQSNGRLEYELVHYSKWLLTDIEDRMKRLIIITQPILFLIIGMVVLVMFTSILLPVFSLINGL